MTSICTIILHTQNAIKLLLDNFLNKIIDHGISNQTECIIIVLNLHYVHANNKVME